MSFQSEWSNKVDRTFTIYRVIIFFWEKIFHMPWFKAPEYLRPEFSENHMREISKFLRGWKILKMLFGLSFFGSLISLMSRSMNRFLVSQFQVPFNMSITKPVIEALSTALLLIFYRINRQNWHFKMRTFPQAFVKEDRELTVLRTLVSNLDPSRSSKGK